MKTKNRKEVLFLNIVHDFIEAIKREPETVYVYQSQEGERVYVLLKNSDANIEQKFMDMYFRFKKQHPEVIMDFSVYGEDEIARCYFPMDGTIFS